MYAVYNCFEDKCLSLRRTRNTVETSSLDFQDLTNMYTVNLAPSGQHGRDARLGTRRRRRGKPRSQGSWTPPTVPRSRLRAAWRFDEFHFRSTTYILCTVCNVYVLHMHILYMLCITPLKINVCCDTASMSAARHSGHACCVTADRSAVSHTRHVCCTNTNCEHLLIDPLGLRNVQLEVVAKRS